VVNFDHRVASEVDATFVALPVCRLVQRLVNQCAHFQGNGGYKMAEPLVRVLDSSDASDFQRLRLRGLQEFPAAFSSSYEEEVPLTGDTIAARLGDQKLGVVFGAFIAATLVGVTGIARDRHRKLAHRALMWGVYVAPEGRQHGVGRALGHAAIEYAKHKLSARQVILGVGATNKPAIALYERLGFEPFGIEPAYLFVDGEYRDEMLMIRFLVDSAR
jgi:RimJ/RimL family protein N-acetyltransferase